MEKRGEPGIFSHTRWRKRQMAKICRNNRLHFAYCSTDNTLNTRCVRQSPPTSYVRVVSYLVPWLFLLFWDQCTHAQSNPFYHPFYSDVTWEKIPGPLPLYRTGSNGKLGGAWVWGYGIAIAQCQELMAVNRPSLRASLIMRMSNFTSEREGEFCMGC